MSCQIPRGHPVYEKCQGYFVRGLTSFGLGCNQIGTPGVYVDLSNKGIENWINDIIRVRTKKHIFLSSFFFSFSRGKEQKTSKLESDMESLRRTTILTSSTNPPHLHPPPFQRPGSILELQVFLFYLFI